MAATGILSATLPPFLVGACSVFIQRDLDLTATQLAVAISTFFVCTAMAAPLTGRWCTRVGWRLTLIWGVSVSTIALVGMAWLATNTVTLAGWLALAGVANAAVVPASNATVAALAAGARLGPAIGITQAAVPLTGTVAGAAVPTLVGFLGWRITMVAACSVPVLAIAILATMPVDHSNRPRLPRSRLRGKRRLVLFAVTGALGTTLVTGLASMYVLLVVQEGVSPGSAGTLLAVGGLAGAAVRLSSGLAWSTHGPTPVMVSALLTAGAGGCALLAAGPADMLIPATLLAFAGGWGWPGTYTHLLIVSYADDAAAASAFVLVGLASGAVIGPILMGVLADRVSAGTAWWSAAILAALAAMLSLRLGADPRERG